MVQMTRQEVEDGYNGNGSDEKSSMDQEKDDNSDDGTKDGNIDMEVDGDIWHEVQKKTQSAVSPTDENEIVGRWFAVVYKGKRAGILFIAKVTK